MRVEQQEQTEKFGRGVQKRLLRQEKIFSSVLFRLPWYGTGGAVVGPF